MQRGSCKISKENHSEWKLNCNHRKNNISSHLKRISHTHHHLQPLYTLTPWKSSRSTIFAINISPLTCMYIKKVLYYYHYINWKQEPKMAYLLCNFRLQSLGSLSSSTYVPVIHLWASPFGLEDQTMLFHPLGEPLGVGGEFLVPFGSGEPSVGSLTSYRLLASAVCLLARGFLMKPVACSSSFLWLHLASQSSLS